MSGGLTVWLYGSPVARIERSRNGRLRLLYTDQAFGSFALGTPLLSYNLPLSSERFANHVVTAFLEGLLPEGDALRTVAEDLDLRVRDTFALISALGRDCAGALVIQPDGDAPPVSPTVHTADPVSITQLAALIDNLRSVPLGIDTRVRISLGGAQEKLLLTEMPGSTWGRPVDGTPSTHILKPEIRGFSKSVENEAFCMRVAQHAGLNVAGVETMEVRGRSVLLVTRYDRRIHADGSVERIHQEDFCQALGLRPAKKYEEDGGPSLAQLARIIQVVAPPRDLDDFLRAVTLNVVLGNGDAHAKNVSLLHEPTGLLRLAPLYDLLCTVVYDQNRLAMTVSGIQRIERVTRADIVNEAASWGLGRRHVEAVVDDFLTRVPGALHRALQDVPSVLPEIALWCRRQLGTGGS